MRKEGEVVLPSTTASSRSRSSGGTIEIGFNALATTAPVGGYGRRRELRVSLLVTWCCVREAEIQLVVERDQPDHHSVVG